MNQPNILLVVSDQERQRDWIPDGLTLPNRQRLIDGGIEFTRYHTHSSPCSPSRASLFTGRYVSQHHVTENVVAPGHTELDPAIPTIGHLLRGAGYDTSFIGKWHLSHSPQPDMEAYGFSDWSGNDRHFMGWAGTGWEFDPSIADQAAHWLADRGARSSGGADGRPWLLVVGLVNPHDVMWYPIDQPDYQAAHVEDVEFIRSILDFAKWKEAESVPAFSDTYDRIFDTLPPNFDDDLFTKPAVQRQWLDEQQHGLYGYMDPADTATWLRQLDYYWRLHQEGDRNLGVILDALDASGAAEETAVIFTADHGDMCGSHGLRSKGPFVYDEIMRVPLYVRVPGLTTPATVTDALGSHVDLARTVCSIAGVSDPPIAGVDLSPVLADPSATVRDFVMFAQDQAWYESCIHLRYAIRGLFDGRYKYARYYGVGGSFTQAGQRWKTPKRYDVDAAFEDHDHELYDLQEDPHELVNLANDRSRRGELRDWFERLAKAEATEFAPLG